MTVEDQLKQIAKAHGVTVETIEDMVRARPTPQLASVIPLFRQSVSVEVAGQ